MLTPQHHLQAKAQPEDVHVYSAHPAKYEEELVAVPAPCDYNSHVSFKSPAAAGGTALPVEATSIDDVLH